MQVFDAAATRAAIPIGELLDAVEAAFRDVSAGRDRSPLRTHVGLPGGDLLLMPGVREGGAGSTVKLVTVTPGNASRGLPTIHASVTWLDATTGAPRAVFDGATITAMRTGAASGVATRLLARTDARVLGLLGAGAQAGWQVRGVLAARPIEEVRVYARDATRRRAFADELAADLGPSVMVRAVPDAEAAVRGTDVVCAATTSAEPVFDAAWIDPGCHVNGVGAYRSDMVELPPDLFGRAALIAVDAHAAALAEAGDVLRALADGVITDDALVEIGRIDRAWAANRDPRAITIFKSVGLAIQDVAATEIAARRLLG
ncbi:MAG: ornithine cyclodeaminase family protein [Chloroflexota bacterium]